MGAVRVIEPKRRFVLNLKYFETFFYNTQGQVNKKKTKVEQKEIKVCIIPLKRVKLL